jgi:SAM-dependent methyltransferase
MTTRFAISAAFLLSLLVCSSDGHWIGGGGANPGCGCSMCSHNRAHRAGMPMDHAIHRPVVVQKPVAVTKPRVVVKPVETAKDEYSDEELVTVAMSVIYPVPGDVVYDLGCGDGRYLIEAVKHYGCQAVGIEINPRRAAEARENVKKARLENRIKIITGDARWIGDVESEATIVVMWQFDDLVQELKPRLTNATRLRCICTIAHPLPFPWSKTSVKYLGGKFYVYRR